VAKDSLIYIYLMCVFSLSQSRSDHCLFCPAISGVKWKERNQIVF
jgi:hypothetical protein